MTDKETSCRTSLGVPTERAVLERSWVAARRALLMCRATLRLLPSDDIKVAWALAAVIRALESMGVDE